MKQPIRAAVLARYLMRDRVNVALACCALVAAIIWITSVLVWGPVTREHGRKVSELKDASENYRMHADSQATSQAVREVLQLLEGLDERLGQQADRVTLMTQIADMAAVSELEILGQTYDESKEDSGLFILRQEISFQGPYASLRGFLYTLPALPGLTRVEELSVERSTAEDAVRGRLRLINYRKTELEL